MKPSILKRLGKVEETTACLRREGPFECKEMLEAALGVMLGLEQISTIPQTREEIIASAVKCTDICIKKGKVIGPLPSNLDFLEECYDRIALEFGEEGAERKENEAERSLQGLRS